MLVFENISLALNGLRANKTRSFLTMLGIIIGIASVITIMTIGTSLTNSITDSMSAMGATNITVSVSQKRSRTQRSESGFMFNQGPRRSNLTDADYITADMISALAERYPDEIRSVVLTEAVGNGQVKHLDDYANVSITGYNDAGMEQNDLTILAGREFTDRDYEQGKKVCVISNYTVGNMFGTENEGALGEQITVVLNNRFYHYTVVGVYEQDEDEEYDADENYDDSTNLYLPLLTAQNQNHSNKGFSQFTAIASTDANVDSLMDEIETFFNNRYYRNNENFEISCMSLATILEEMTSIMGTVSLAISVIAGISLLVGGIGVMNIMLVSVTERTKEIGTRKALGATNGSIRVQFIVESITLCVVGGIIGVVLGIVIGAIAADRMGYSATAPVNAIIIAVAFSAAIGIFFGYYPANKAAKMNPIDALRYE